MVRTVTCTITPTAPQTEALCETMEALNDACDYVSTVAWTEREFNNYRLRKRTYRAIRERFGLSAQLAQQAVAKVAAAYKASKHRRAEFRPHGAVTFDCRCLRLIGVSVVSLTLLNGRAKVALSIGGYHAARLKGAILGETDLTYQPEKGRFRLHFSVKSPSPEPIEPTGVLGVDLGITNLAVTSDGEVFSSAPVRGLRRRHRRFRAKLQAIGTRAAKRKLRRRRRREQRFARHVNHVVSKEIVACAKGTGRGIALEELTGYRDRITVRRTQRATFSAWSFHELRAFITYKAEEAGLPVFLVDPKNTSRTCPACRHIDRASRKSLSLFSCVACQCSGLADHFAAVEIGRRAACKPAILLGEGPGASQGKAVPL
jgi:IS605 OrfB family transposase